MPSDMSGDDAHREPGFDSDPDATRPTPEAAPPADGDPDGDPGATQPSPEAGAGAVDETTEPTTIAEDADTDELPVAPVPPTEYAAPPVDDAAGAAPADQGHRNRRRALIATLVVAILALVGLGAAILATEGDDTDDPPTSTSPSTTSSTAPSTTEGLTPAPSDPTGTTQTTGAPTTTTVPPTTTTQPTTTTTAPTTSTTTSTTSSTSTSTSTTTALG
jgi:hypothetical protein